MNHHIVTSPLNHTSQFNGPSIGSPHRNISKTLHNAVPGFGAAPSRTWSVSNGRRLGKRVRILLHQRHRRRAAPHRHCTRAQGGCVWHHRRRGWIPGRLLALPRQNRCVKQGLNISGTYLTRIILISDIKNNNQWFSMNNQNSSDTSACLGISMKVQHTDTCCMWVHAIPKILEFGGILELSSGSSAEV